MTVPDCLVIMVSDPRAELTGPGPQRWRITVTPEGQQVTLTATSPIHPAEKHADEA
jgi:hypothetical protein